MGDTELERLVVRLLGDTSQYTRALAEAQHATEDVVKNITHSFTELSTAIAGTTVAAFAGFQTELAKIEGLAGVARSEVDSWANHLLALGPTLGKTPEELAKGMFFVASGGARGAAGLSILTSAAKASAAGLGEVKVVANAVKSAYNAYQAMGLKAADATDILVAAVREGKLEAADMAAVVGRLLPLASAMKVDFAEVAGAMAAMTRTGSTAAEAAVSIQAILSTLQKPSKKGTDQLAMVGLSYAQLRDTIRQPGGMIAVLRMLDKAFGDDEEAMARVFPNIRALRGAMNLLSQDSKKVDEVMKGVRNSTGATEAAFQIASQTLSFQFKQMTAQVNAIAIGIGEMLASALAKVNSLMQAGMSLWVGLGTEIQRIVVSTAAAAAGFLILHPLLFVPFTMAAGAAARLAVGILGVAASFTSLIGVVKLTAGVFLLWFNPMFVLIRTLVSLGAAMLVLVQKAGGLGEAWRKVEEGAIGFYEWLKPIGAALYTLATTTFKAVTDGLMQMGEVMLSTITSIAQALGLNAIDWQKVQDAIVVMITTTTVMIANFGAVVKNTFGAAGEALQYFFKWATGGFNENRQAIVEWYAVMEVAAEQTAEAGEQLQGLGGWFMKVTGLSADTTKTLIKVSAAVIGLVGAFLAVGVAISLTTGLLGLFKITQLASVAVWALWIAGAVIAKAVTLTWAGILLVAKVAVWLFNTAIMTTGIIMAALIATGLVAAAAAVSALVVAFAYLAGTVWGAYAALSAALGVLLTMPGLATGPLETIGGIFSEWGGILSDVVRAAKVDMPLAWAIMSAGATLAVAQVKDLWPPLWKFLEKTSAALWDLMANTFELEMRRAIINITSEFAKMFDLFGIATPRIEEAQKEMSEAIEGATKSNVDAARMALKSALSGFRFEETDVTKGARANLQKLRDDLDMEEEYAAFWAQFDDMDLGGMEKASKSAEGLNADVKKMTAGAGAGFKQATSEIHKFDAAMTGSVEAAARIAEYAERFSRKAAFGIAGSAGGIAGGSSSLPAALAKTYTPASGGGAAGPAAGASASGKEMDWKRAITLLDQIAYNTAMIAEEGGVDIEVEESQITE